MTKATYKRKHAIGLLPEDGILLLYSTSIVTGTNECSHLQLQSGIIKNIVEMAGGS